MKFLVMFTLFFISLFSVNTFAQGGCTAQNHKESQARFKLDGVEKRLDSYEYEYYMDEACKSVQVTKGEIFVCLLGGESQCGLFDASTDSSSFGESPANQNRVLSMLGSFFKRDTQNVAGTARAGNYHKIPVGLPYGDVLPNDPFIVYKNSGAHFNRNAKKSSSIASQSIESIVLSTNCKGKQRNFSPVSQGEQFWFSGLPSGCSYKYKAVIGGKKKEGTFDIVDLETNDMYSDYPYELESLLQNWAQEGWMLNYQKALLSKDYGLDYDSEILVLSTISN